MKTALLVAAVLLAGALQVPGQTLTFAPQPLKLNAATAWGISACADRSASVPAGRIYRLMVDHGITPIFNVEAIALLHARQKKSIPAQIAKYAGWAATGFAFLATVDVIKANPSYVTGASIGAGVANLIGDQAAKEIPGQLQIEAALLRDSDDLRIPDNGCVSGVVLGTTGKAFVAEVK